MGQSGDNPDVDRITTDVACVSCGYNLRTLALSGDCPECGRAVAETLHYGLAHADLEWLKTLRSGTNVLAWTPPALLCAAGLSAVCVILSKVFGVLGAEGGAVAVLVVSGLGGFVAYVVGTAMLTMEEPDQPRPPFKSIPGGARACVAALFFIGAALLLGVSELLGGLMMTVLMLWAALVAIHSGRLAYRGGEPGITQLATAAAWVAGVASVLLAACLLVGCSFFLLLPSYGGTGWAIIGVSSGCLFPAELVVVTALGVVLMFRLRGMLDRSIVIAQALAQSTDEAPPPEPVVSVEEKT